MKDKEYRYLTLKLEFERELKRVLILRDKDFLRWLGREEFARGIHHKNE